MFKFEAQTGRILPYRQIVVSEAGVATHIVIQSEADRTPHNFYRFVFYDEELEWVRAQVKEATLGSGGLEYPYLVIQAFHGKDLRPAIDRGRVIFDG